MISLYMKKRKINKQTQIKIRKYLEYMYEEEINEGISETTVEMIGNLPNKLKNELTIDYYGNLLKSIPLLKSNFSTKFIEAICFEVKEFKFIPGDIVYNVNKIM